MVSKLKLLGKIALGVVLVGLLIWGVQFIRGCKPDVILPDDPTDPVVVVPRPPIIPRDDVIVARRDSSGNVTTDRIRVDDAPDVDEVVTVDSTTIAIMRPRSRWFPDIRGRETRVRVLEGDNERVVTTIQKPPLVQFSPGVSVGVNFTDLESVRPSLGVELARVTVLRLGVNLAYDTKVKQFDIGPEGTVLLRDNLVVGGGMTFNDQQIFVSLKYKF